MGVVRVARISAPLMSVVVLHILILNDQIRFAPAALASGLALSLILGLIDGAVARGAMMFMGLLIAGLAAFQIITLYVDAELAMAVTLLPVLIHLWLAWVFGRTLSAGREPLIRRFSRLSRGELPEELEGYTRRLTVMWTVLMLAMAATAAVTAIGCPPDVWSWVANVVLPLTSLTVFLAEHAYRAVRFAHLGHNSPLKTLQTLSRPKLWMSP